MNALRRRKKHTAGLTLAELLVSIALFSIISVVTMQLYLAAYTEFDHASGIMTLNQRARTTIDKVAQILKTAAPAMSSDTQAFVHPNLSADLNQDMYEADFLSTICFIPITTYGVSWRVDDVNSAAYVADATTPRYIYETEESLTTFVTRQPSLYRYRIAWNHLTTNLTTQGRNVPARAVYFERLDFARGPYAPALGALGWGEGANSSTYALSPWIADTGTPINNSANRPRILGRDVHSFTIRRTSGNVILLRLRMYNRDPVTDKLIEGMTMRRIGMGANRDDSRAGANKRRIFAVDLVTNVHLPNTLR